MSNIIVPITESEDFYKKIEMFISKEITDVRNYIDFMKQEDNKNDRERASGFYYMAKDEYTHVIFLNNLLEEDGYKMTEVTKKQYVELVDEFENMFQ